tara:strand:+ start:1247 stop:2581 length:1335 start_codon:yes stop_codon:yes gene_type:complete
MAGTFENDNTAINKILTQEANRIGGDIHKSTMHTSPWIDLIKQTTFPEGMGYQLNTLIYDRALPLKSGTLGSSPVLGVNWNDLRHSAVASGVTGFTDGQSVDTKNRNEEETAKIDFTRKLKPYSLKRAVVESPKVNVEDLRYAAHRTEQLRAVMDLLSESVRHSWENRYRDEYDRIADNCVLAKTASSTFISGGETKQSFVTDDATGLAQAGTTVKTGDLDANNDGTGELEPSANISNALMDKIYFQLVRAGAGPKAYGRENGRPIFSVVLSSEASYKLQTESDKIRDDIRYNSAKVGELIAPLGVEKSFRGFYHLVDDLTTRYKSRGGEANTLVKVEPYTVSGGVVVPNSDYESAEFEAAYVLVDDVMESLIPAPISGANGLTFDPVNYKGDFRWTNIPDADINPDGTIGFFRGIMASASKPIKTNFGYVVIFKRDSSDSAVV